MLRSSGVLVADDVTFRCRLRCADQSSDPEFSDYQEMVCAMRVWHESAAAPDETAVVRSVGLEKSQSDESLAKKAASDPIGKNPGPELVLNPVQSRVVGSRSRGLDGSIRMSRRFQSFGSRRVDSLERRDSRSGSRGRVRTSSAMEHEQAPAEETAVQVTIPISDIIVVDMIGDGNTHVCNITTVSSGLYEFTLENRNGQDMLLAFLKTSLPKERFMKGEIRSEEPVVPGDSCSKAPSFDVEAFTAKNMTERIQNETISEKLRRKVGRVFSSFEEMSSAFTECACGWDGIDNSHAHNLEAEARDSPPQNQNYDFDAFEISRHATPTRTMSPRVDVMEDAEQMVNLRDAMKHASLPSGLSVEEPPELERGSFGI